MLVVKPIGIVRNEVKAHVMKGWGQVVSELVFNEEYTEAFDGIEGYSHVLVIFWMDRPDNYTLRGHIQNSPELAIIGRFAGRGPYRPNPIGVTAVPLIGREKNILRVRGLDIIDGTPILDLKPYTPAFDRIDNAQTPDWSRQIYEDEGYF